jgi:hypothetical protein
MLTYAVIGDNISITIGEESYSTPFSKETYDAIKAFEDTLEGVTTVKEYNAIANELRAFLSKTSEDLVESACPLLKYNSKTGTYHLVHNKVVSSVALPQALVDRILDSQDKGVDFMPIVRMWVRFLRNPNLKKKGNAFANKFFNFVNLKYQHPKMYNEFLDAGFSPEIAAEKATVYQMKVTNEGLLNGYKVSREVMHKFVANEDGEPVVKPRYTRTFDVNTGEITSEGLPEFVEERLFEPAMMGSGGDAFSCVGPNGFDKLGHFIKVGCIHALDSWEQVNTNDNQSCVPGLHVGGLMYIAGYSGEIHNVFIDPMHVGAVPDDVSGAIRCKQYFVHSSLAGVNGSIYHSSKYAKATDAEWSKMLEEATKVSLDSAAAAKQALEEQNALV